MLASAGTGGEINLGNGYKIRFIDILKTKAQASTALEKETKPKVKSFEYHRSEDGAPRVRKRSFTEDEVSKFQEENDGFPVPCTDEELDEFDTDVFLFDSADEDSGNEEEEIVKKPKHRESKTAAELLLLMKKLSKLPKLYAPGKPKIFDRLINGVNRPRLGRQNSSTDEEYCPESKGGQKHIATFKSYIDGFISADQDGVGNKSSDVCAVTERTSFFSSYECAGDISHIDFSSIIHNRNATHCSAQGSAKLDAKRTIGKLLQSTGSFRDYTNGYKATSTSSSSCSTAGTNVNTARYNGSTSVGSQPTSPTSSKDAQSVAAACSVIENSLSVSHSAPASPRCLQRSKVDVQTNINNHRSSTATPSPQRLSGSSAESSASSTSENPWRYAPFYHSNIVNCDEQFSTLVMAKGFVKARVDALNHNTSLAGQVVDAFLQAGENRTGKTNPVRDVFISKFEENSSTSSYQTDMDSSVCDNKETLQTQSSRDSGVQLYDNVIFDTTNQKENDEGGHNIRCYFTSPDGMAESPAELFDNSWSDSENIFESDFSESDSEEKTSQTDEKLAVVICKVEDEEAEEVRPGDKLYNIAHELLKTEKTYVERLRLVDQIFHFKVSLENRVQNFFPADVIPQMFSNIKSIYKFHQDFLLPQLEARIKEWDSTPKLGDLMKSNAPFLKLYSDYVKNFDGAMTLINQWREKSPKFAEIMDEIHKTPECCNLTLQHHMLGPIQRVPRYEMLLKDYLKHLPDDSPDRIDTEDALKLVTIAASHSNEAMKKIEKFRKLLEIHQTLGGAVDLVSPTRELVKEGRITKISARREKTLERYIFLFNDLMLICTEQLLGTYSVRARLDIDGMEILSGANTNIPNTFKVCSKQKSIEFQASSLEECTEWIVMLWQVIGDCMKKKESRKGPDMQENIFGKRAPEWIRDEAVTMCMTCAGAFSAFRRRHHCRACGMVVCAKCSSKKSSLSFDDHKLSRVCDKCHKLLSGGGIVKVEEEDEVELSDGGDNLLKKKGILQVKANDPSLIAGYLHMSIDHGKNWIKRWCSVHESFVMYIFKAHQDVCAVSSLPLPGYQVALVSEKDMLEKQNVLRVYHKNAEYYLSTANSDLLKCWMDILEKVVMAELPKTGVQTPMCRSNSESDSVDRQSTSSNC